MEKLLPTAEEKERMEEEDTEEETGDIDTDEEKEAIDKTEEDVLSSAQPKDKKQADVLNLNNEVVKMRKEVKRVRALIIRKLTRHISGLKKKKGKEMEIERNQRRAARLLEEIHAMKVLSPDMVTKKALQKNLKFEEVCKNLKSTISDRAIARIATHPSFNKKIEVIRAAVKAFKEERMRGGEQNMEKMQNEAGEVTAQSPDTIEERGSVEGGDDLTEQLKETLDKEGAGSFKDAKDSTDVKAETDTGKAALSVHTADVLNKELKSVTQAPTESIKVKDIVKSEPHSKDIGKKASPTVLQKKEESDLESSDDEEKEYFDDSTEERFHRQSSQSEESDDDFFVGKVSKFKRKQKNLKGEIQVEKDHEVKGDSADKMKTSDKVQGEPDELESRLKSKPTSLQTVFCSSLSCSKQSGNVGRGRGGNASRGQRKPKSGSGLKHFDKKSKDTGPERNSEFKYNSKRAEVEEKGFASGVRGRQQGRGNVIRQKSHMGGGVFSHQAPQQALHPSWEASKKRKEQQGQILAFQGKKIKFDD